MTSTMAARHIVATLVHEGITTFILSPGSRSAPFAYALYDAAEAGIVTLHIEIDERVAGFVALGSGRAGKPAAVITTSGTAVANLHPAVEEAQHAGVPLIVISADRPLELRGVRANQTTDHKAVLRGSVRMSRELSTGSEPRSLRGQVRRAARLAQGFGRAAAGAGPVHLNIGLPTPLTPDGHWESVVEDCAPREEPTPTPKRTVVVGGPSTLHDIDLSVFNDVPVLAEPTSQLWAAKSAMMGHPLMLGTMLRQYIQRVVVIGHPTLSREVQELLQDPKTEVIVVDEAPTYTDTSGNSRAIIDIDEVEQWLTLSDPLWMQRWEEAQAITRESIDENVDLTELSASFIARFLTSEKVNTILGASSIIREANLYATPGKPFIANRGLAGIDGTVSTAIGHALATGAPTRVVLGDLATLHDLGALAPTAGQNVPPIDVVIIDDHGGSIFASLEHGRIEEDTYRRVFRTEKVVSVRELAEAMGADYAPISDAGDFIEIMETMPQRLRIVHVDLGRVSALETRAARSSLRTLIADDLDAFCPVLNGEPSPWDFTD